MIPFGKPSMNLGFCFCYYLVFQVPQLAPLETGFCTTYSEATYAPYLPVPFSSIKVTSGETLPAPVGCTTRQAATGGDWGDQNVELPGQKCKSSGAHHEGLLKCEA